MIQKSLNRHACTAETRLSAHAFGILPDDCIDGGALLGGHASNIQEGRRLTAPFEVLFRIATPLFAVTLASEGFFHPLFFAGFQVEGVAFDFLDNVLLLYFPLEAAQGILKSFAVLHDN